jgi:hypothetical protein
VGKRSAGQLPLDDAAPRAKGSTERAAEKDLRSMRSTKIVGEAVSALEVAYRLTAREVDRAEREQDRWGKLNAVRELRAVREKLGPMTPATPDDGAGEFWSTMSTPVADGGS